MSNTLEEEIVAKGLTAPRITPEMVEANISSEYYFTAGQGVTGLVREWAETNDMPYTGTSYHQSLDLLTFCVLVTHNGFRVTGESACVSPENYDQAIGERIARENAIDKLWPLMGYELASKLKEGTV